MVKTIDFAKAPAMEIDKLNCATIKTVMPENVFAFQNGILGFEHIKEYVILINRKVEPFLFMHALDGSNLSFVCVETFRVCPAYNLSVPDKTVKELELNSPDDALLLSLVTVRKNAEDTTANLLSPIIINMRNSRAAQIIPEKAEYPVRFKIWETLDKASMVMAG